MSFYISAALTVLCLAVVLWCAWRLWIREYGVDDLPPLTGDYSEWDARSPRGNR